MLAYLRLSIIADDDVDPSGLVSFAERCHEKPVQKKKLETTGDMGRHHSQCKRRVV